MSREIEVKYIEPAKDDTEIEFLKLGDGTVHNYGLGIPF